MSTPPAISIIIPAKNEARNIGSCLDAISAQRIDEPFETIVIDSGSTDGTQDLVARYDVRLHQIRPEEFGHGRTRNLGARLARGEILVFLNADATPVDAHWLQRFHGALQPDRVAGVYGRQIARPDAYPMERFFLDYWYGPKGREQRKVNGRLDVENIFFSTVNCAIKRHLWEANPFDETVVMTEDQVWSRKTLEAGYTLTYAPECAVVHSHNYTLKAAFRRFFDAGWSAEASFIASAAGLWHRARATCDPITPRAKPRTYCARGSGTGFRVRRYTKGREACRGRRGPLPSCLPERLKRAMSANYRSQPGNRRTGGGFAQLMKASSPAGREFAIGPDYDEGPLSQHPREHAGDRRREPI